MTAARMVPFTLYADSSPMPVMEALWIEAGIPIMQDKFVRAYSSVVNLEVENPTPKLAYHVLYFCVHSSYEWFPAFHKPFQEYMPARLLMGSTPLLDQVRNQIQSQVAHLSLTRIPRWPNSGLEEAKAPLELLTRLL